MQWLDLRLLDLRCSVCVNDGGCGIWGVAIVVGEAYPAWPREGRRMGIGSFFVLGHGGGESLCLEWVCSLTLDHGGIRYKD